jgi:L-aminopeptidase/D-esterase-like protein
MSRSRMNRRKFIKQATGAAGAGLIASAGMPLTGTAQSTDGAEAAGSITDIAGIKVGHFTDTRRPTGCTVVIAEAGAVGGVDVRGGGPGTRETDLLNPVRMVQKVHAIMLSGGSAFGLDTATGAMRYLEERDVGFDVRIAKVPIVPAAILFDLGVGGNPKIRPDAEAGYQACVAATNDPFAEGSVGAGAGATVGKAAGGRSSMRGGIGTACITTPDGLQVGAIVAVNAIGDIYDHRTGEIVAGARKADGSGFVNVRDQVRRSGSFRMDATPTNTTIGIIVTNARLSKTDATRVAQVGHDGLARSINPAHLQGDGDTLFVMATGEYEQSANLSIVSTLGAEMVSDAIVRAVKTATGLPGIPAFRDL